jgi:hypothetical protein
MNDANVGRVRSAIGIVVVSVWLGAALLLAFSVAPNAFAVLPSRALAGDVVGSGLRAVFLGGLVAGATAVVVSFGRWRRRVALGLAMMLTTGIAQFAVAPRIATLRADIGGVVDALPADDARRVLFGRLHAVSIGLLGVAMCAAALVLIISVMAMRQRSPEPAS